MTKSINVDLAFASGDSLGEGPLWSPESGYLFWVDVLGKRWHRGDPLSGQFETRALPYAAANLTLCDNNQLLVSFLRQPGIGTFDSDNFETIDLGEALIAKQRFNDGACDSRGRLWTATYDGATFDNVGCIVCIDGGRVVRKAEGIRLPNGIRWSPDERTMYFVDSRPGQVWAYDFDLDAARLGTRRLLIDYDGTGVKPDGCAVDVDGGLWVAEVNRSRIARYTPAGKLDQVVEVPTTKPTSVSFGGADNRTLYITSRIDGLSDTQRAAEPHAGAVFAARVEIPGQAEFRYRINSLVSA